MTDRTRSPQPNKEAILRLQERKLELRISDARYDINEWTVELRKVRRTIKRACGDRETQI